MLAKIFTWWNGSTFGALFTIWKRGEKVGEDEYGNRFFEERNPSFSDGRKRRWVVYNGIAEPSRITPDWHGWLHHTFDAPPTTEPLLRRAWEKEHRPNLTGTPEAYYPKGSLWRGGDRAAATGDYQAWSPDDA
ncbi:MAG: NADH:ubiquinone oxidoreductase subunit NDUFA12 [Pseudomonadota bacterium]